MANQLTISPPVAEIQSAFQTVKIVNHVTFGHQLYQNDSLIISESDEAYARALVNPLLNQESLEQVSILGGGHGAVLKLAIDCLKTRPEFNKAALVEIDIEVIRLSKRYLARLNQGIFNNTLCNIIVGDPVTYIENTRRQSAVISDINLLPTREGVSQEAHLDLYLKAIRKSLKPGGTLSMRLGCPSQTLLTIAREAAQQHFTNLQEQQVFIPSFESEWLFLSGTKPAS